MECRPAGEFRGEPAEIRVNPYNRSMTASTSYFPRNPKFTDSFERDLANDDVRHIGRDEPSLLAAAFKRVLKAFASLMRGTQAG